MTTGYSSTTRTTPNNPRFLKEIAINRATASYVSVRKKLWQDLHPRVYINIRNRDLSLFVNNAAFDFWTAVAKRNHAFARVYAGPTPASAMPKPAPAPANTPRPLQLASPSQSHDLQPDRQAAGKELCLTTIESRLEAIKTRSVDELIQTATHQGVAVLEDFLPDAKRQTVLQDFATIKDVKATPLGVGVRCFSRKPSAQFREVFDDVTLHVTKILYGIGYRVPKDRFAFVQRLELETQDRNDSNTILHIDRHVPSFKFFYYPHPITDPDQSPFGYVPESHFINDRYIDKIRSEFKRKPYASKPFAMENPTDNPELPILVQGNTLVLAYTNGLHRRTPFGSSATPGAYREAASWMFYNLHTRLRLLSQVV